MDKIFKDIAKYTQEANLPPKLDKCCFCHVENASFKQHDCRERKIRILLSDLTIQITKIFLFRWKCTLCNHKFIFYPKFLMPYKRFTTDSIIKLNENYINTGETSYRKIAHPHESHYAYDSLVKFCELSHSTLWNWMQTIADSIDIAKRAVNILIKKNYSCTIHRDVLPINPKKFRCEQRKGLLIKAEEVLRTQRFLTQYEIDINLFPRVLIT